MDRGSKINVGSTTLLKSAPGRSWDIICDRTIDVVRTILVMSLSSIALSGA